MVLINTKGKGIFFRKVDMFTKSERSYQKRYNKKLLSTEGIKGQINNNDENRKIKVQIV